MAVTMPGDADWMASAAARLMDATAADAAADAAEADTTEDTEGAGGAVTEAAPEPKSDGKASATSKATPPPRGPDGKFLPGGSGKGGGTPAPAAKATTPSKATPATAKAEPASKADAASTETTEGDLADTVSELQQLEQLAQRLGYKIDNARVSVAERAQFREQRRAAQQQIAQLTQQANEQARTIIEQANVRAAHALKAAQAWDSGDFDGFARALGRQDWNDLNREAIARFQDPNFRKMQELEAWKREQEENARRAEEQQRQYQQEQAQLAELRAYKADLSAQMAQSQDALISAFADDPMFIEAIYNVQKAQWDGHSTVTPEEAVRIPPHRGGSPLFDEMRKLYSRLERVFRADPQETEHEPAQAGGSQAPQPEPAPKRAGSSRDASVPVRQSKPSTSIPQRKATEAAAPAKWTNDRDFLKYATSMLQQAQAHERE